MATCMQATDSGSKDTYLKILATTPNADLITKAIVAAFQPNTSLQELQSVPLHLHLCRQLSLRIYTCNAMLLSCQSLRVLIDDMVMHAGLC